MISKTEIAALWLAQSVGNAIVLALAWWWLSWPDAHVWQVAASFVAAAVIVFIALWLHCGTLACFAAPEGHLTFCFRRALARIPAFVIWVLLCAALIWGLHWVKSQIPQVSVRLAQLSGASPRHVYHGANWMALFLQWIVLPAVLLPVAAETSAAGMRGWHVRALRRLRSGIYWVGFALALIVGVYLPYKLIWWKPHSAALRQELWSFGVRFGVAYLLCVTAWMAFAAVLGRGRKEPTSGLTAG